MLAVKRTAGVPPEVNVRECTTCMPLPSANKASHFGFETQRISPVVQNRGISGPTKGHEPTKFILKKEDVLLFKKLEIPLV